MPCLQHQLLPTPLAGLPWAPCPPEVLDPPKPPLAPLLDFHGCSSAGIMSPQPGAARGCSMVPRPEPPAELRPTTAWERVQQPPPQPLVRPRSEAGSCAQAGKGTDPWGPECRAAVGLRAGAEWCRVSSRCFSSAFLFTPTLDAISTVSGGVQHPSSCHPQGCGAPPPSALPSFFGGGRSGHFHVRPAQPREEEEEEKHL